MARDIYHDIVRIALEKEGWAITDDPYLLRTESIDYEVDLGIEKLLAATDGKTKILVEIKSFLRQSKTYEMHTALGQFNTYMFALERQEPDRELYMAIPHEIYLGFMQQAFIQELLDRFNVKLIVFDPLEEQIELWIP